MTLIAKLVLAISFALSSAAYASPTLDAFRILLDKGDVDAIEQQAITLNSTYEPGAVAAYREITNALLKTTHPERIETIKNWNDSYPKSAHANAAALWVAIHSVQLQGLQQTHQLAPPTVPQFSAVWLEKRTATIKMASDALAQDPDTISILDAWLVTRKWRPKKPGIQQIALRLIDLAPDRTSVLGIVDAYAGWSQQTPRTILEACLRFGGLAKDYDSDKCLIENSLPFGAPQDVRNKVMKTVEATDDPRLGWAKLAAVVLYGNPDPSDFDELADLHAKALNRNTDLESHRLVGDRFAYMVGQQEYGEKINRDLIDALDEWLEDDPYNNVFLEQKLLSYRDLGKIEQTQSVWRDALVYGWQNPEIWILAAAQQLKGGTLSGLKQGSDLLAGGVAASQNSLHYLMLSHWLLDEKIDENDASDEAKKGPLCFRLRLARLSDGLCTVHGAQAAHFCDASKPLMASVSKVLSKQSRVSCAETAALPVSQLQFSTDDLESRANQFSN